MFPPSGRQCPGEHVMLAEIREREPKGGKGERAPPPHRHLPRLQLMVEALSNKNSL